MLYTVEVRLIGCNLSASMSEMRSWLDHNQYEPVAFRYSAASPMTAFRVDFNLEQAAIAFAEAFEGRLLGSPISPDQPVGAAIA